MGTQPPPLRRGARGVADVVRAFPCGRTPTTEASSRVIVRRDAECSSRCPRPGQSTCVSTANRRRADGCPRSGHICFRPRRESVQVGSVTFEMDDLRTRRPCRARTTAIARRSGHESPAARTPPGRRPRRGGFSDPVGCRSRRGTLAGPANAGNRSLRAYLSEPPLARDPCQQNGALATRPIPGSEKHERR
jgi:hypothetical protein